MHSAFSGFIRNNSPYQRTGNAVGRIRPECHFHSAILTRLAAGQVLGIKSGRYGFARSNRGLVMDSDQKSIMNLFIDCTSGQFNPRFLIKRNIILIHIFSNQ